MKNKNNVMGYYNYDLHVIRSTRLWNLMLLYILSAEMLKFGFPLSDAPRQQIRGRVKAEFNNCHNSLSFILGDMH